MAKITKTDIASQNIFNEIMQLINQQCIKPDDVENDWFICYEDYKYYYDDSITKQTYNKALKNVKDSLYSGQYYYAEECGKYMLQLSDNHTLWNISCNEEYFKHHTEEDFEADYFGIVEQSKEDFEAEFGFQFGCYGRSGRHICVDITLENLKWYFKLKEKQEELEENVINYFNDYSTDNAA